MARLLPGVCPHPCPTQSCPKDVAHCHCCWEVLASLPRVQPNTVPGQGSYTPNFSGLPDIHTCAYKEVHVRVCPNLLRAPFVPWELSIPRGWRTASTLSPHWAILVLTLACGRAALLIPHGSLHSQTLPSGSSFLPPPPPHPCLWPLRRDRLCAGELQDGAMQEAPAAVPPGLRLPLLPQQQGPAAEPPETQIQVSRRGTGMGSGSQQRLPP